MVLVHQISLDYKIKITPMVSSVDAEMAQVESRSEQNSLKLITEQKLLIKLTTSLFLMLPIF